MDDGWPYPVGVDQPDGLGALCGESRQVRAEYSAPVSPWLDHDKIDVLSLYGPLMQQALGEWGEQALYVALDTSMLWDTYCLIRLSVIYRGRAVPLVWCVLKHGSAQVSTTPTETSWIGRRGCCLGL